MKLPMRRYLGEDDNQTIRQFLCEVFLLHDRRAVCWPLYRWDRWYWQVKEAEFDFNLQAAVFLWKTGDGRLAAVLHPEAAGEALLQVHPTFQSLDLEVEMILAAETQYATQTSTGQQRLVIWVHETDLLRQGLLRRRGYVRNQIREYEFRRSLDGPIPAFAPPAGFQLCSLGELGLYPAGRKMWQAVIKPGESQKRNTGLARDQSIAWISSYRNDLDLVALTSDGEIRASSTFWFDHATSTAGFEPVWMQVDFQSLGLNKAILAEGLNRVRDLGATLCLAAVRSTAGQEIFTSLGLQVNDIREAWVKEW